MLCFTVNPSPHIVGDAPAPVSGVAYRSTLTAVGGLPRYTWTYTGSLPMGITFTGGVLAGTTRAPGSYSFAVTVIDANNISDTRAINWFVQPAPVVLTAAPPAGAISVAYAYTFAASGGVPPLTYTLTGSVPPGLTFVSTSDWAQVTFSAAKNINTVRVYTLQDNYAAPSVPTDTMTFSAYGLTVFDVQALVSGVWTTVASVTNNNLVKRTVTFPAVTATAVRVLCHMSASGDYARLMEIEAIEVGTGTNVALAANGGTASASSSAGAGFPASALNDGNTYSGWSTGGGWNDNTQNVFDFAVLSGTPTTIGNYSFSVTASDPFGNSDTKNCIVAITPAPATISGTLPNASINVAYNNTLAVSGGATPYSNLRVISGALPPGWNATLAGSTITVSGTATSSGTFSFTLALDSSNGSTSTYAATLTVYAALAVTGTAPAGYKGTAYSWSPTVTGGWGGNTFSLASGTLPPGVTIAAGTGISGNPTTTGTYTFVLRVTDSKGNTAVTSSQSVTIGIGVTVSGTVPDGEVGRPYNFTPSASGGTGGPYTWSYTGSLPGWATFNSSTGAITGTPTSDGQVTLTISAKDTNNVTGSLNCNPYIYTAVSIVNTAPDGAVGSAYSYKPRTLGGRDAYTYSSTGTLPAGTSLNTSTGEVSGTITSTAAASFAVIVTDFYGATASTGTQTPTIYTAVSVTGPSPSSVAAYSYQSWTYSATGGSGFSGGYTYSGTGTYPAGMTLDSSTGILSGTITSNNNPSFRIVAIDSSGNVGMTGVIAPTIIVPY